MKPALFYRVANTVTQQGLWYDFNGNHTGLIHGKFSFCTNSHLPMPYDKSVVGWLSATKTLEELYDWVTPDDIKKLQEHGYRVHMYEAKEYRMHNNHWVIKQDSSNVVATTLIK